jgi:hypothetical protein
MNGRKVNRNLNPNHSRKDSNDFAQLGAYYIVSESAVTAHHVDLADYGKKLGLLRLNEVLESEEKQ